jgi:hypothetical protein
VLTLRQALVLGLSLLSSCSIYDESLLDPTGEGDDEARGGSRTLEPGEGNEQRAGTANGASGGKGSAQAGGSDTGATGGSAPSAGAGSDTGSGGMGAVGSGGGALAGGGAATAGATGNGGSPPVVTGDDLLDDMEDGNFYLTPRAPRYGFWYVAGDTTVGAKLPKIEELVGVLEPAREASTQAVHFVATGFKGWGASVGLSFTDQASKRVKYDAGNATGVSFWIRGSVTGNAKLRVQFPLPGTDPLYELCGSEEQGQCLDHYATQVTVTADWQQVTIPFSSLHQAGWGAPVAAFDPTEMVGIEWSAGTVNLDVWLDDLALIRP